MKVVALIDCPGLIRHILEHLKLWKPVVSMPRPRSPPPIEETPESPLFAGQYSQYALPLYRSAAQAAKSVALEGVDDIPPDDVPTIIQA